MLKKIGLAVALVVVLILGLAALQPADYVVRRETVINAPAEKIFPYLNSAKLGEKWGPWLEVDPDAKMTYSGPESGVGSKGSWDGGKQLGTGSATIDESVPNERVGIALEYSKPMVMTQHSVYELKPAGEQAPAQTVMSWTVTGKNNFMGRVMCLFMNMDKMVGSMFEKGLSNLKTLVESQQEISK
jgi:hypothetical protein